MSKEKISTILHRAADKYLLTTPRRWNCSNFQTIDSLNKRKEEYSCCAILKAEGIYDPRLSWSTLSKKSRALKFVRSLGVKTGSFAQFDGIDNKQGARYNWLKFAALYAEEQGL